VRDFRNFTNRLGDNLWDLEREADAQASDDLVPDPVGGRGADLEGVDQSHADGR
jgi:hypothetical protein